MDNIFWNAIAKVMDGIIYTVLYSFIFLPVLWVVLFIWSILGPLLEWAGIL